jgi:hypothetical protein
VLLGARHERLYVYTPCIPCVGVHALLKQAEPPATTSDKRGANPSDNDQCVLASVLTCCFDPSLIVTSHGIRNLDAGTAKKVEVCFRMRVFPLRSCADQSAAHQARKKQLPEGGKGTRQFNRRGHLDKKEP